jgi:hypothetical protein|tara:strand:+ start:444 stop:866 length:423 start_codon:yes stop_codon:yes gene_type:complete
MVKYIVTKDTSTKANDMTKNFEQLKMEMDAAILEGIWVPNDLLPERYHDNREGGSTLERVERIYNKEVAPLLNADPREKSVVISDGVIQHGNQERIDVLNRYRDAVENEQEDYHEVNEDRLYRNQQAFASVMELNLEEDE